MKEQIDNPAIRQAALLTGPTHHYWRQFPNPQQEYITELERQPPEIQETVLSKYPQLSIFLRVPQIKNEDENSLEYTQRIRLNMIAEMTKDGMPEEPKHIYALATVLDSIDKQELTKRKLDEDAKKTASDKEAQDLIATIMSNIGNTNPFMASTPVERDMTNDKPVTEGVVLVENELDIVPKTTNYEDFMKQYREKNPKDKD